MARATTSNSFLQKLWQNLLEWPVEFWYSMQETINSMDFDQVASTASVPTAFVLNAAFFFLCQRQETSEVTLPMDLWDDTTWFGLSSSDFERLMKYLQMTLLTLSIVNMVYLFSRSRRYNLLQPDTARPWKLSRNSKELIVWDPPLFSLYMFCLFSPIGLLLLMQSSKQGLWYHAALSFILACTLYTLSTYFVTLNKQQHVISAQMLREYDSTFVMPRLFPKRRNQATQIGGGTRKANLLEELDGSTFFRPFVQARQNPSSSSPKVIDIR